MGSEANESEMNRIMAEMHRQQTQIAKKTETYEEEVRRFETMRDKLNKDNLVLHWYEGFWMGFTTGAIVVTVLYAAIGK